MKKQVANNNKIWRQILKAYIRFRLFLTLLISENICVDDMETTRHIVENIQILNIANIFFVIESSNTIWIYDKYKKELKYNTYSIIIWSWIYSFAQILVIKMNNVANIKAIKLNITDFFLVSKICVVKTLRIAMKNKYKFWGDINSNSSLIQIIYKLPIIRFPHNSSMGIDVVKTETSSLLD